VVNYDCQTSLSEIVYIALSWPKRALKLKAIEALGEIGKHYSTL
jgi:hypothetical protein